MRILRGYRSPPEVCKTAGLLGVCALLLLVPACRDSDDVPETELWLAEHPTNEWALTSAAANRMAQDDFAGAARAYEALIALNPDEPFNYALLAVARSHLVGAQNARLLMDEAVAVALRVNDPDLSDLINWRRQWASDNYRAEFAFAASMAPTPTSRED